MIKGFVLLFWATDLGLISVYLVPPSAKEKKENEINHNLHNFFTVMDHVYLINNHLFKLLIQFKESFVPSINVHQHHC